MRSPASRDKILTTSFDKTARLWNIHFEKQEVVYWGHGAEVVDAKFSLLEDIIATASLDSTARIYQAATGLIKYNTICSAPIKGKHLE